VTEVLDALAGLPLIGGPVVAVLRGDTIVSGATLSRFFALHVIVLPWVALVLLGYHFTLVRKHGIAPPKNADDPTRPPVPFFPHHLLRSFAVSVVVLGLATSVAALFPRPVGHAANPYQPPGELVSTWAPVDVSLGLIRHFGAWGFALFTLLGLSLAFLPLFDRSPERRLRRRPVVAAVGLTFFAGFVAFWLVGHQVRSVAPGARPAAEPMERAEPGVRLPPAGTTPMRPAEPATREPGRTP